MPHVSVTINGKTYRMACDDGQENHLIALAERFDAYVNQLRGAFGEIGDQRLTVMAGVMVTDELQELERRVAAIEHEIAAIRSQNADLLARSSTDSAEAMRQLAAAAERIEAFARRLSAPIREA
jgi:cell division protein ZapA